jgi:hypothetical protein
VLIADEPIVQKTYAEIVLESQDALPEDVTEEFHGDTAMEQVTGIEDNTAMQDVVESQNPVADRSSSVHSLVPDRTVPNGRHKKSPDSDFQVQSSVPAAGAPASNRLRYHDIPPPTTITTIYKRAVPDADDPTAKRPKYKTYRRRHRRDPDEIVRRFACGWEDCPKAYGYLHHLNTHVAQFEHGPKRRLMGITIPSSI